jgi:hypothetical protein
MYESEGRKSERVRERESQPKSSTSVSNSRVWSSKADVIVT